MVAWPFRNRAPRQGPPGAPGGGPSPDRVGPPGWGLLPPLDTTALAVQLTIATDSFEAELPSRQTTPFLAPLGHDVVDGGPAGVIGGLLTPLGTPRPNDGGVDLPVAQTPRPAVGGRAAPPSPWVAQRMTTGDEPASRTVAADGPGPPAPAAPLSGEPPPVWRLPAVEGPPPTAPTLTAAKRPESLPVVQLTAVQTPPPAEPPPSDTPPVAEPPAGAVAPPAEAPAESTPLLAEQPTAPTLEAPTVSRAAESTAELPSAFTPTDAVPPAIPVTPNAPPQPPRKLGLGAPLPGLPGSTLPSSNAGSANSAASVQRTPEAAVHPTLPVVTPERPTSVRSEAPTPANEVPTVPLIAQRAIADEPAAALLSSFTGSGGVAPGSGDDAPGLDSSPLPVALQRAVAEPEVAPTPVRPVLSGSPIGPTALQRAVEPSPVASGHLTAQRSTTSMATAAQPAGAPALHHGPAPRATSSAIVHAALSSGAASLDADGAVVFSPPVWAESTPEPAVTATGPVAVQRAVDEAAAPPSLPGGSDIPAAATDAAAPAAAALSTTAPGAAAATGAAAAAGLPVDELAARLYDRIHDRLRAEFRLDRERRGRVTDLAR